MKLAYALICPAKQILQYADFELMDRLWSKRFEGKKVWDHTHEKEISDVVLADGHIKILDKAKITSYDMRSGTPFFVFGMELAETGSVDGSAVSQDGNFVATTSADFGLSLINLSSGQKLKVGEPGDSSEIFSRRVLAISPDNAILAVAGFSSISLFNVQSGRFIRKIPLMGSTSSSDYNGSSLRQVPNSIIFSPPHRGTVIVAYNDSIGLYELSSGRSVKSFSIRDALYQLAYSPNGDYLAIAGHDGLYLLDPTTFETKREASGWTGSIDFSRDARFLARGGHGYIEIRNLDDWEIAATIETENPVFKLHFSSNLSSIASVQAKRAVVHKLHCVS